MVAKTGRHGVPGVKNNYEFLNAFLWIFIIIALFKMLSIITMPIYVIEL